MINADLIHDIFEDFKSKSDEECRKIYRSLMWDERAYLSFLMVEEERKKNYHPVVKNEEWGKKFEKSYQEQKIEMLRDALLDAMKEIEYLKRLQFGTLVSEEFARRYEFITGD